MKTFYAWMLVVLLIPFLMTGCKGKTEETVTQAPTQEEPLQTFPESQVPAAEPQPAVTPPVDTSIPRADVTAKAAEPKPARKAKQAPKENYAPEKKKDVRYHVVQKGETLQKISQKYYGTTKKWRSIYKANRDSLPKGPDKLQVGSKLAIP